eukprot:jgi/Chlat1/7737/Chrsp66S07215
MAELCNGETFVKQPAGKLERRHGVSGNKRSGAKRPLKQRQVFGLHDDRLPPPPPPSLPAADPTTLNNSAISNTRHNYLPDVHLKKGEDGLFDLDEYWSAHTTAFKTQTLGKQMHGDSQLDKQLLALDIEGIPKRWEARLAKQDLPTKRPVKPAQYGRDLSRLPPFPNTNNDEDRVNQVIGAHLAALVSPAPALHELSRPSSAATSGHESNSMDVSSDSDDDVDEAQGYEPATDDCTEGQIVWNGMRTSFGLASSSASDALASPMQEELTVEAMAAVDITVGAIVPHGLEAADNFATDQTAGMPPSVDVHVQAAAEVACVAPELVDGCTQTSAVRELLPPPKPCSALPQPAAGSAPAVLLRAKRLLPENGRATATRSSGRQSVQPATAVAPPQESGSPRRLSFAMPFSRSMPSPEAAPSACRPSTSFSQHESAPLVSPPVVSPRDPALAQEQAVPSMFAERGSTPPIVEAAELPAGKATPAQPSHEHEQCNQDLSAVEEVVECLESTAAATKQCEAELSSAVEALLLEEAPKTPAVQKPKRPRAKPNERLRNQLKDRQSLAALPRAVRTRRPPLEFWRNERVLYARENRSLPVPVEAVLRSPDPVWPRPKKRTMLALKNK